MTIRELLSAMLAADTPEGIAAAAGKAERSSSISVKAAAAIGNVGQALAEELAGASATTAGPPKAKADDRLPAVIASCAVSKFADSGETLRGTIEVEDEVIAFRLPTDGGPRGTAFAKALGAALESIVANPAGIVGKRCRVSLGDWQTEAGSRRVVRLWFPPAATEPAAPAKKAAGTRRPPSPSELDALAGNDVDDIPF